MIIIGGLLSAPEVHRDLPRRHIDGRLVLMRVRILGRVHALSVFHGLVFLQDAGRGEGVEHGVKLCGRVSVPHHTPVWNV
jgi:hypothetical protein